MSGLKRKKFGKKSRVLVESQYRVGLRDMKLIIEQSR